MFHERTKHIDIKLYFVRDIVNSGYVCIEKIHTDINPVDMLTKCIPVVKLQATLKNFGVVQSLTLS